MNDLNQQPSQPIDHNPTQPPDQQPDVGLATPSEQHPQSGVLPSITRTPFNDSFGGKKVSPEGAIVLLILDGWGIGPDYPGNAIKLAQTPTMDKLWITYPHTQLTASGQAVGLPEGVDGNSETGHMNMGAGSIIFQDLPRINAAIADGSFYVNRAFTSAIEHVKQNNSTLHLMGLIGSGFVHSNMEHLFALLNLAKNNGIERVLIHGFTDGRDSPPTAGTNYIRRVMDHCQQVGVGEIASLMGRYYAMDRDKKWDRIEKAYNSLLMGAGMCTQDPIASLQEQYQKGVTDEYIEPINVCHPDGAPKIIQDNDAVIFYNFRVDRPRELTRAFVMPDFERGYTNEDYDPYHEKYHKTSIQEDEFVQTFQRQKILSNLYFVTMTAYEKYLPVDVAFPKIRIKENVGTVLSMQGLRQLRLTETEKERMVTYYMNGQDQDANPGEDWVIFPSKGVKSYADAPEMTAQEITEYLVKQLEEQFYDVYIVNICNGDMVGHTGNLEAGIKACEMVDRSVNSIVQAALVKNATVLITADHGNVEEMINMETGEPDTEHSTFPVPFIVVNKKYQGNARMLPTGILADIIPTILHLLGAPKPEGMSGRNLFLME